MAQQLENQTAAGDPLAIGRVVSRRYAFTVENIKAYAGMAGDTNRLHHDPEMAKASRFGALIASAAHLTGVLMSVVADKFARNGEAVGLGFTLTLRRAVKAGCVTDLVWEITGKHWSDKLGGNVIELSGEMRDLENDLPLVLAEGRMLILQEPDSRTFTSAAPSDEAAS